MVILSKEQQYIIESLYRRMYKMLFSYALSTFENRSLAEEAVQDTFQIACLKVTDLASSANPEGWLMNTLKYVMSNIKQRLATRDALFASDTKWEETAAATPQGISLETESSFIATLGETDYKLLKKVALKELTVREAAHEFGLSEQACSKRVQRSKKKLQKNF